MLDLSKLSFDYMKFISLPRCVCQFFDKESGSGCSLTAFWYALGFQPMVVKVIDANKEITGDLSWKRPRFENLNMFVGHGGIYGLYELKEASDRLAGEIFEDQTFSDGIMELHDTDKEDEAIAVILHVAKTKLDAEILALVGVR